MGSRTVTLQCSDAAHRKLTRWSHPATRRLSAPPSTRIEDRTGQAIRLNVIRTNCSRELVRVAAPSSPTVATALATQTLELELSAVCLAQRPATFRARVTLKISTPSQYLRLGIIRSTRLRAISYLVSHSTRSFKCSIRDASIKFLVTFLRLIDRPSEMSTTFLNFVMKFRQICSE